MARLAVYGHVERKSGSSAGAFAVLLDRMLARGGHEIDLYAIDGFVRPEELFGRPGFSYHPVRIRGAARALAVARDQVPWPAKPLVFTAVNDTQRYLHERAIARAVAERHRERPYDLLLALNIMAPFRVEGLRCLAWTQGPPNGEHDALKRLRRDVTRYAGPHYTVGLDAYYRYRSLADRRHGRNCDAVVCGSEWARSMWKAWGFPAEHVHAIPFPVDTDAFTPPARFVPREGPPVFLWLGRVVPRKRLDLALDAFRIVRAQQPGARLVVAGAFTYAKGYRTLLDAEDLRGSVEYRQKVPRDEVPALLRSVDALVQPSENENYGTAVGEALACGLPVVLGPTNGTADYVGGGGFLFDAYTPESVAEAMLRASAAMRARREDVGEEARRAAETRLSIDATLDALLAAIARESSA